MKKYLINVCGPNGSGKTTFTKTVLARLDFPVVDPDRFSSQGLSEIAAGKLAIRQTDEYIHNGVSFIRESTLTSKFDIRLMRAAREAGYKNILIYLGLPSADISWQRVMRRVNCGGHAIPENIVRRRFPRSLKNLETAKSLADRLFIIDNSQFDYREENLANLLALFDNS